MGTHWFKTETAGSPPRASGPEGGMSASGWTVLGGPQEKRAVETCQAEQSILGVSAQRLADPG